MGESLTSFVKIAEQKKKGSSQKPRQKKICLPGSRPGTTQSCILCDIAQLRTALKFRIQKQDNLLFKE